MNCCWMQILGQTLNHPAYCSALWFILLQHLWHSIDSCSRALLHFFSFKSASIILPHTIMLLPWKYIPNISDWSSPLRPLFFLICPDCWDVSVQDALSGSGGTCAPSHTIVCRSNWWEVALKRINLKRFRQWIIVCVALISCKMPASGPGLSLPPWCGSPPWSECDKQPELTTKIYRGKWHLAKAGPPSTSQRRHDAEERRRALAPRSSALTYADALVIQLRRGVPEVSKAAMLAVLPPSVVLAADASDDVEKVDVAAAVGMAVAFAVWREESRERASGLQPHLMILAYGHANKKGNSVDGLPGSWLALNISWTTDLVSVGPLHDCASLRPLCWPVWASWRLYLWEISGSAGWEGGRAPRGKHISQHSVPPHTGPVCNRLPDLTSSPHVYVRQSELQLYVICKFEREILSGETDIFPGGKE